MFLGIQHCLSSLSPSSLTYILFLIISGGELLAASWGRYSLGLAVLLPWKQIFFDHGATPSSFPIVRGQLDVTPGSSDTDFVFLFAPH